MRACHWRFCSTLHTCGIPLGNGLNTTSIARRTFVYQKAQRTYFFDAGKFASLHELRMKRARSFRWWYLTTGCCGATARRDRRHGIEDRLFANARTTPSIARILWANRSPSRLARSAPAMPKIPVPSNGAYHVKVTASDYGTSYSIGLSVQRQCEDLALYASGTRSQARGSAALAGGASGCSATCRQSGRAAEIVLGPVANAPTHSRPNNGGLQ